MERGNRELNAEELWTTGSTVLSDHKEEHLVAKKHHRMILTLRTMIPLDSLLQSHRHLVEHHCKIWIYHFICEPLRIDSQLKLLKSQY